MEISRNILLGLALCFSLTCSAASDADFQLFWDKFRTASLTHDYPTLVKLIYFPLEIKGITDDTPVEKYGADTLPQLFPKLMSQLVMQYEGNELIETTLEDIIRKKIKVSVAKGDKHIRIEEFQFTLINGKWYLTEAYLQE